MQLMRLLQRHTVCARSRWHLTWMLRHGGPEAPRRELRQTEPTRACLARGRREADRRRRSRNRRSRSWPAARFRRRTCNLAFTRGLFRAERAPALAPLTRENAIHKGGGPSGHRDGSTPGRSDLFSAFRTTRIGADNDTFTGPNLLALGFQRKRLGIKQFGR
jgi:hypothetical protein